MTSKTLEIDNPKFYSASSALRGFSFRPHTHHLAVLTQASGKDVISIHKPKTREVQRAWFPDTIDAHGLVWSPDGRWLVVWESAAQGHKVLFYTSDGHLFKDWRGPVSVAENGDLGPGIKLAAFSPDGHHVAISDGSSCICMVNALSMSEEMRLQHPHVIQPRDTLQVSRSEMRSGTWSLTVKIWQEQKYHPNARPAAPVFHRAAQPVVPLSQPPHGLQETKSGCNLALFDSSSTLLATRLEDAPSTIWIWDIPTSELRAVLMYHAKVNQVEWHPVSPELLLMRCEGEDYGGVAFAWDPLSEGPRCVDFAHQLPGGNVSGNKDRVIWLKSNTDPAAIFFSDKTACILGSLTERCGETLPWTDEPEPLDRDRPRSADLPLDRAASPRAYSDISDLSDMDEGGSELNDTFDFKRLGQP
ncbi:hypothetical protein DL765_005962 [Monosporascus sp. GIB2]|nr:hypothetical protein DL765_005962 [Monosporascus sp. GIB2]